MYTVQIDGVSTFSTEYLGEALVDLGHSMAYGDNRYGVVFEDPNRVIMQVSHQTREAVVIPQDQAEMDIIYWCMKLVDMLVDEWVLGHDSPLHQAGWDVRVSGSSITALSSAVRTQVSKQLAEEIRREERWLLE